MKRIALAAIYHTDGKVYAGRRHCDIIRAICEQTGCKRVTGESIQGFINEDNEFLTREEAAKIALANGQVKSLKFSQTKLYSEDLY